MNQLQSLLLIKCSKDKMMSRDVLIEREKVHLGDDKKPQPPPGPPTHILSLNGSSSWTGVMVVMVVVVTRFVKLRLAGNWHCKALLAGMNLWELRKMIMMMMLSGVFLNYIIVFISSSSSLLDRGLVGVSGFDNLVLKVSSSRTSSSWTVAEE